MRSLLLLLALHLPLQAEGYDMVTFEARLLERVPAIEAALLRVEATKDTGRESLAPFWPQLELSASSYRQREEVGVQNPTGVDRWNRGVASLRQYLYGFGRFDSTRDSSRLSIEIATLEADLSRQAWSRFARERFLEGLYLEAVWETRGKALEVARSIESATSAGVDAGTHPPVELQRSQSLTLQAEQALVQARFNGDQAHDLRRVHLGVDQAPLIGTLSRIPLRPLAPKPSEDWLNRGRRLLRLKALAELENQTRRQLGSSRFPVLHGVGQVERQGDRIDDVRGDWRVGLELSWSPDLNRGVHHGRKAAKTRAQALEEDWKEAQRERRLEYLELWRRSEAQGRIQDLAEQRLQLAAATLETQRQAYASGALRSIDLHQAQQEWRDAALERERLLLDWNLLWVAIEDWVNLGQVDPAP